MFLNPGVKSVKALIKSKCKVRRAKQRSIIKNRKLNLLIKPCTGGKKLKFNHPNGSSIKKKGSSELSLYPGKTSLSF